jgi:hypothetical protein
MLILGKYSIHLVLISNNRPCHPRKRRKPKPNDKKNEEFNCTG